MRPLLTPEQMARADRATIDAGTPAEILMDRAGRAVARVALGVAGGRYGKRIAVVCGKGSNGGDGLVTARELRRQGAGVQCLYLFDPAEARGASAHHLATARGAGVCIEPFDAARLASADVVVDAIFGTGFRGPATGEPARAIEAIRGEGAPVVAVDIPSGVDGTTGSVVGPCIRADVTVALAAQKVGTAIGAGAEHAGHVRVADIGIPIEAPAVWLAEHRDVAASLPVRRASAHKRDAGSVVVLGGSQGMSGAAILCARGAERAGAGYVTLGTTAYVDEVKAVRLPEVVSEVVSDGDVLGAEALKRLESVLERGDAVAVGPGLGTGSAQQSLLEELLSSLEVPVVIDADGLNVLAADVSMLERRSAPTVLTPHPKEMARLLDSSVADVQADRIQTATRAAQRFGAIVVLKGARTVVAGPDGTCVIDPIGGPELASAGTGDVLTGVIAALIAAGVESFTAAWAGTFVHSTAGKICSARRGVAGVVAWDVAEAIADAMRRLAPPTTL